MAHEEHRIFRDRNTSVFGRATKVITIVETSGEITGEWFVFIDGREAIYESGRLVAQHAHRINHRTILALVEREADRIISTLLLEQAEAAGNPAAVNYQHDWDRAGEDELLLLWLPGRFKAALTDMAELTRCGVLRAELQDVMSAEPAVLDIAAE